MDAQVVVPQELLELNLIPCPSASHGDEAVMFEPGTGYVPPVDILYEQVRDTLVTKDLPLTRIEVLSMERCQSCAKDAKHRKYGTHAIRMHPTGNTLKLMAAWESQNAAEREQQERERLHQRNAQDKGFIRETFSRLMPESRKERRSKKGRRYVGSVKPTWDPNAPKKYGDEHRSSVAKVSKKKQKQQEKEAKKKAKQKR